MGKTKSDRGREIDDVFRREAVRILTTSGRTIRQVPMISVSACRR
jgi:hypothetical protein